MRFGLVGLALASGQALTELATWHPRDVATLVDVLEQRHQQQNEPAARERRLRLHGLA